MLTIVRAKTIQGEYIGSTHSNLLYELWYESDDRVTRQAASERLGVTVKLIPCPCSYSSPAGQIIVHACLCGICLKCNLLLAQARFRMMQHLSSY